MREIKLTKGYIALVDDEDYDVLSKYKWQANDSDKNITYATRSGRDKDNRRITVSMHRQILSISDPKVFVDHINGNGLDNQKTNLRLATNAQNVTNRRSAKGSSSQYLGVHFWLEKSYYKSKVYFYERWRAQIKKDGKSISLGTYKTEIEAAKAYNEAAVKLHGEFANLNVFPTVVDEASITSKDNLA